MEFFNFKTRVRPGTGKLLVSEPLLPDPNFERSIILLCAHDKDGSFGFVLNKPSETRVCEVLDDFEAEELMAFVGGPVAQDTLHYLHVFEDLEGAQEVLPGIYWGGDFDSLRELARKGECKAGSIKFFLGYSGWSSGQLNSELKENAWIVSNKVDEELIFSTDPAVAWRKSMNILGGRFNLYANYPTDPRLN